MDRQSGALLACSFAVAAAGYWLVVWPQARAELHCWRMRAQSIPNVAVRDDALQTLTEKWTNVEGAAALAVLAPIKRRARTARALLCWQEVYDLADTLSEHSDQAGADSRVLHTPLADMLRPSTADPDCCSQSATLGDGGYLRGLIYAARDAFLSLPSHASTSALGMRGAERIADYQTLHHVRSGGHEKLAVWAASQVPADTGLLWWEVSAAAASSLPTLAMIVAAADAHIRFHDAAAIHAVYWPWVGALHTLLDSLIDMPEDAAAGQPSLLDYATPGETAERMKALASQSLTQTGSLPRARQHLILLTGMACLYLSAPEAQLPTARDASAGVIATIGPISRPALAILRLRRSRRPWRHRRRLTGIRRAHEHTDPQTRIASVRRLADRWRERNWK